MMLNRFKSIVFFTLPVVLLLLLMMAVVCGAQSDSEKGEEVIESVLVERLQKPFTGDLPKIRKARVLRVLVTYSKTNYFITAGTKRGFEYELLNEYEKFLNEGVKSRKQHIKLFYIPLPFDELLTALEEGRGDVAAAGLTITPERLKSVDFADPYIPKVSEVVVLNKSLSDVNDLADLAGRVVYVRAGSSYVTHLEAMSRELEAAGLKPIVVKQADSILTTEDILEMVNAGVVDITVADHHVADIWAGVLPDIVVRKDLEVNSGGQIAWAVRKNNPKLKESLNSFVKTIKKGSLMGNILFKRYYQNAKWIKNPISPAEREKLESFVTLFDKYSEQYGFDWLAIAAQGYQESGLDQSKKSAAGAVGVMQLLPSTAADEAVGIKNIHIAENNIHAGVKYLDFIRERYFSDLDIEPSAQVDFSWAAYNAGPAKINRMREQAAKRGFDPNKWFGNVELVTADLVGREPVDYVSNINKYYVAYKLLYETRAARKAARDKVEGIETDDALVEKMEAADRVSPPPATPQAVTVKPTATEKPKQYYPKSSLKAATLKKVTKTAARYHVVSSADTIYTIGQRYGVSVDELIRINKLDSKGTIHPGDRLRVTP
jgi:membrane-bound lytic murein transglycosylase MltF